MDALRLLSRGTKDSKSAEWKGSQSVPSRGENALPQLFAANSHAPRIFERASRKRKRGQDHKDGFEDGVGSHDFFSHPTVRGSKAKEDRSHHEAAGDLDAVDDDNAILHVEKIKAARSQTYSRTLDERKQILKQHRLKAAWLNPPAPPRKVRRKDKSDVKKARHERPPVYPDPLQSFDELQARFDISSRLTANISDQGYSIPTEVQMAALPLLLDWRSDFLPGPADPTVEERLIVPNTTIDLLTVAPTGSGKTLAFIIPLLQQILSGRRVAETAERHTSAIILAPTKELAAQITNEGRKLSQGTGVRVTQVRKGMRLPNDDLSEKIGHRDDDAEESRDYPIAVKADILVSTPGMLYSLIEDIGVVSPAALRNVVHLVLDEADVLLDPLFREQTLGVWGGLSNVNLHVTLWSATMGSNIEDLVRSAIAKRRSTSSGETDSKLVEAPLVRLLVGLKDSAVLNVHHKLVYAATEQGKLMGLRQLLHPSTTAMDAGPALRPPFLVFTQTIERAVALHSELLYDIPAEAGGISRIAVLHSDLSDTARDNVMTRFRKGEIWVLITTDLLSRGVDFRGINGVVNYDIPTSSAAYVHRVGRTGRAGREGGVAVTLYSKEDVPYLKHVANVIAMAQKQQGSETVTGGEGVQQWLLEALPKLGKAEKQRIKRGGIEARTTRGVSNDSKAAKRARISTKAGFVRREENKRKGAITGRQRRLQAGEAIDDGDETDFGGFD